MIDKQISPVDMIDQITLTALVQNAYNSETFEVINWKREQLHGGAGTGNAVYRFSGNGRDKGKKVCWSLILKTIRPTSDSNDSSAWNYPKREPQAYQSGWLDDLPGGLSAPRNFGVVEHPDGTYWIWLEDVKDDIGPDWPLVYYGVVARHLGQFNGSYLVNEPLPSYSWLSSGWLRSYVQLSAPAIPLMHEFRDNPLLQIAWPDESYKKFLWLWEQQDIFINALNRLPQTICHHDLFCRNSFARKTTYGKYETVVIDWSYVGYGAIGQDLVPLIIASCFGDVDFKELAALEEIVFEGYLQGLHDAGWKGDPRLARLGYTGSSLRYRFGEIERNLSFFLDQSKHTWIKDVWGCSVEEYAATFHKSGKLIDGLADEALRLIEILG
jgi:hypothetical protein